MIFITLSSSALRPEKKYVVTPESYGLIYKNLKVKTSDGYIINTWFLPAQDLLSVDEFHNLKALKQNRKYELKYEVRKPTIIICDGDSGNMSYQLAHAERWVEKGFNVVLFDWRGFGESSDFDINNDNLFYNEFLIDYLAVINEVNLQPEVIKDCIGLFGFSTGAYFSFAAAYNNPSIKAVVLRGLITNFAEAMVNIDRCKPGSKERFNIPKDYNKALCPINIASTFNKACMLIVGRKDELTPVIMSRSVLSKLSGVKKLWIVEEAAHGGRHAPEVVKRDEFIEKSSAFFGEYL
jgi:pimeloyl-ACP methyl ester carboxylesterase